MAREMNLGFGVLIGVVWMEPLLEDTKEEKKNLRIGVLMYFDGCGVEMMEISSQESERERYD